MTNTALENLENLRLPELRKLFAEATGETTRSPNKKYLIRRIRESLDAQAAEIIEEDQAIERMQAKQAAAASGEPGATEKGTASTKPKRARKTTQTTKKAAGADAKPSSAEQNAAPTKPKKARRTTRKAARAPKEATSTAPGNKADTAATAEPTKSALEEPVTASGVEPTNEEMEAFADAAEMADAAAEISGDQDGPTANTDDDKPLRTLTVAELQQRYLEVVGRPTGSSHRRYLIWKIREAQKGRIPVGPRNRRNPGEPAPDFQILPVRMESELVKRLDDARERLGLKSRMDLFRKALATYLDGAGETDLAAAIVPNA